MVVRELRLLVSEGNALMIGPVRQELLSGIRHRHQFETLRGVLRAFSDIALTTADHERAAGLFTACRRRGIQGSNTDFLICAVAERLGVAVYTLYEDARVLPVRLHCCRFHEEN